MLNNVTTIEETAYYKQYRYSNRYETGTLDQAGFRIEKRVFLAIFGVSAPEFLISSENCGAEFFLGGGSCLPPFVRKYKEH